MGRAMRQCEPDAPEWAIGQTAVLDKTGQLIVQGQHPHPQRHPITIPMPLADVAAAYDKMK